MEHQAQKYRKFIRAAGVVFVVFAVILLWCLRKSRTPDGPGRSFVALGARLPIGRQASESGRPARRLEAKDVDAAMARRLIARSLRQIVNAKSYKMVMTTTNHSVDDTIRFYSSFTLIHERSPTRGELFRMDTLNFEGPADNFNATTMKLMPGTSHTEITNEAGNWDMGDGPGKEGVAFLLTGNAVPIDTVGMQQSYEKEAEGIESADDHSTIEVSDVGDAEKPVLSITRTKQAINGFSASTRLRDRSSNGAPAVDVGWWDSARIRFGRGHRRIGL